MEPLNIGFALCGSFCTFSQAVATFVPLWTVTSILINALPSLVKMTFTPEEAPRELFRGENSCTSPASLTE